ncbi:MAG: tetratricopeptide repeat protein [Saprospiraceae bacterium]|uniref:Tetratricopeptide repeat protein n=1 Tax=Candidatus Defluviibacterium haderslevense TaxID=2981993 RepID=A0A9D7S733_9BACT|nr:tetratricopeptide repeat protein [Candidatus Defluviibacterium haderslevense]
MKIRSFIFLIFISFSLNAQQVDSLIIKQVDSLIKLNRLLVSKAKFDDAIIVIEKAQKLVLSTLGKKNTLYATCLFFHGRTMYFNGHLNEAEHLYLEAKSIRELILGKNNAEYAWTVNNLAGLYWQTGSYKRSENYYLEACSIREKVLGSEHPDYAWTLHNLAILYVDMGYYEKAEPLYLKAKEIRVKVLGKSHPDYGYSLNHLANLYKRIGDLEKAEMMYLQAKDIFAGSKGMNHPDYAWCISNLSNLYQQMGNFKRAEILIREANQIREKTLGENHPDYISGLESLGTIYLDQGIFDTAEVLFLKAIEIRVKVYGKENLDFTVYNNNLGLLYQQVGNFKKAETIYLESKIILEKILEKEHPSNGEALAYLANLYVEMGDYVKAELYYLQAKEIFLKSFGKNHMDYLNATFGLTDLFLKTGKFNEAKKYAQEFGLLQREMFIKTSNYLSEQELNLYINEFNQKLNLHYLIAENDPDFGGFCYDNILFYKGYMLQSINEIKQLTKVDSNLKESFLQYKSFQRRLGIEYSKPIKEQKDVDELEERCNSLEKLMAKSARKYRELNKQLKWQEIQEQLKDNEVAIEFFQYYRKDTVETTNYAAMLLRSGLKQPKFIPLFEEKSLDSLLNSKSDRKADYVNTLYTLTDRGAVALEIPKKSLYEILWKPLEKELAGVKTIYFSPSGLLHRINLDAIPISETETLADKYQLIELNSTRQLVVPTQIKNGNNDAILYGGIQFEQDSIIPNNEPLVASRSIGVLSFNYVDSTLRGGSWNYLAGTEREVNTIEKMMLTSGIQTKLKKGIDASEDSFKNIGANNNPSPRILHIATHGYFFVDPKEGHQSSVISRQEESVFKMSEHPMLRSGLIMAGGNAAWQGKQTLEGREDGILTAYEISQMNLSNTELVVLSACETGLGDIQGNEGVYGLQRAFKIAGAKHIIMSLWQVPDKQTSLLMTTFYKKYLEEKMTIPDAFHAAQKELRDNGLDPYNWAGFVLVE